MNTLVVYLPSSAAIDTLVYDYALTMGGHTLSDHACVAPALLPATARGGEVVAIVPVTLLSWHRVKLPKGIGAGSARLRPVLEGLLEDRLLMRRHTCSLHLNQRPVLTANRCGWRPAINPGSAGICKPLRWQSAGFHVWCRNSRLKSGI